MSGTPQHKPEVLSNGATVFFDPLLRKYGVLDGGGVFHTYRYDLPRARAFAASLPAAPPPAPPPAPISRSPRAMPLPEMTHLPTRTPSEAEPGFLQMRKPIRIFRVRPR
jgi:hypothetical protein